MDRLLSTQSTKLRSKSGMTTAAQIEKQLQDRSYPDSENFISKQKLEVIKKENRQLFYLISFMSATACRVSEALNIGPWDITSDGFVKINTLKRGKPRIVNSGMAADFMVRSAQNGVKPFDGMNRFAVYRYFKRYGIETQLKGRKKKTVTHLPRHLVAQQIQRAGMDIELSKQALGHNSIKSTGFYHESESKK